MFGLQQHVLPCILTTLLCFSTAFGVQLSTSAIYKQTAPATVLIRTEKGAGTGFIVEPDGVIVTAWHVVDDVNKVEIQTQSGEVYDQVYLLSKDERKDIAILKIPAFDLSIVTLGNSNEVDPGTPIIVIGNPLGIEELQTTVTDGIVSGIRVLEEGHQVIQISAPISPGNSGGPVISDKGEVVGVAAFKIIGGENLNFAIPINYVRGLLAIDLSQPLSKWESSPDLSEPPSKSDEETLTGRWTNNKGHILAIEDGLFNVRIFNSSVPKATYFAHWETVWIERDNGLNSKTFVKGSVYGLEERVGSSLDSFALEQVDIDHLKFVWFWEYPEMKLVDGKVIIEGWQFDRSIRGLVEIWTRIE